MDFRRANSGGAMALDRNRRAATTEVPPLIGEDLFDQKEIEENRMNHGGGLFDSFEFPEDKTVVTGKVTDGGTGTTVLIGPELEAVEGEGDVVDKEEDAKDLTKDDYEDAVSSETDSNGK